VENLILERLDQIMAAADGFAQRMDHMEKRMDGIEDGMDQFDIQMQALEDHLAARIDAGLAEVRRHLAYRSEVSFCRIVVGSSGPARAARSSSLRGRRSRPMSLISCTSSASLRARRPPSGDGSWACERRPRKAGDEARHHLPPRDLLSGCGP